ncbi:MAG: hypothetical protein DRO93_15470 [Candidatus Thorarchaeota archaeon]|nr:MAG: hypothetical protein DRO93_15470 [Candidatus Thorarchaeota archaeon]
MARLWAFLVLFLLMGGAFPVTENQHGDAIKVEVGIQGIPPVIRPWAKVTNIGNETMEDMEWYVVTHSVLLHHEKSCYGSLSLKPKEEKTITCPYSIALFGPFIVQFVINYGYEKCPVIKTLEYFAIPPLIFGGEVDYNQDGQTPNIAFIDTFTGEEYYVGEGLKLITERENLYTEPMRVGDKIEVQAYPPMVVKWLPTNATITKIEWFW